MKVFDFVLLVILFATLGFGIYVAWLLYPGELEKYQPILTGQKYEPSVAGQSKVQFYPNLRYVDDRISYKIESACSSAQRENVEGAFSILESRTKLEFYESSKAEIDILCSDLAPEPKDRSHFIAGEGGPSEIINTTAYYVILSGKVSLFREEKCSTPNIALHEILHALGFDHNSDRGSIMYPVTSCDQELDSYITEEIDRLYSVLSLADLGIEEVSAEKSGIYLNFHIEVANYGLRDAENVALKIFSEDELAKEFDLQDLPIGTRKFLDAKNIRVSRSAERIRFSVETAGNQQELSKENNEMTLVLSSS